VTIAVITGWQCAAAGFPWVDALVAWIVGGLILFLAYGLYRRAVPILVDASAIPAEALRAAVDAVPGVRVTRRIRSHGRGESGHIDVVVGVNSDSSTRDTHTIADEIERVLAERFQARDVCVHVEPLD
jgi:divalent metal cation (Fe/Co/Zn/Cd) transporter